MTHRDVRRYASLVLCALIVLSGCAGPGTDGGDTPMETPTPSTTHPTDEQFAPGVSDGRITDVEAFLAAHRETLLADGARIGLDITRTAENGTVLQQSTQTVRVAPDALAISVTSASTSPSDAVQIDSWLNETTTLFRFQRDDETEYRVLDAAPGRTELVFAGNIGSYVRATSDVLTVRSIETRNGQRLAMLRAEATLANGTAGPDTTVKMGVDSSGVIRSFTLNQTQPDGERYHLDFAVEQTGVTVSRPAWVDSVPSGVFLDTDVAIEGENGTAITITNGGPDAIPAGATVTIVADGVTYDTTVSERIEAGDQLWIWVASDSGELTAGSKHPSTDAVRSLGRQAFVEIRTNDGIRLASADFTWRTGRDSR